MTIKTVKGPQLSQLLKSLCIKIAFLTDVAHGHNQAQEWLVRDDSTQFWPLLMCIFNEPNGEFIENELIFCQRTLQQYFTACISFNEKGKQIFINLLLNAIMGIYSLESPVIPPPDVATLSIQITPFIRTLLINIILGPEHVNLIVEFNKELLETSNDKIKLDSLIPLYDCPLYHPSYPLHCYYIQLTTDDKVNDLRALLLKEAKTSTVTKKQIKGEKGEEGELSYKLSTINKSQTNTTELLQIDIFNPDVIHYKLTPANSFSSPLTCTDISFMTENGCELSLDMDVVELLPSKLYGCMSHMRIIKMTNCPHTSNFSTTLSLYHSSLELFTDKNGLFLLAEIFPHIHPGKWSVDMATNISVSLLGHPPLDSAQFLHPHSYVMLGLGMRLREYGVVLGEGRVNGCVLLQGVLRDTKESKRKKERNEGKYM